MGLHNELGDVDRGPRNRPNTLSMTAGREARPPAASMFLSGTARVPSRQLFRSARGRTGARTPGQLLHRQRARVAPSRAIGRTRDPKLYRSGASGQKVNTKVEDLEIFVFVVDSTNKKVLSVLSVYFTRV